MKQFQTFLTDKGHKVSRLKIVPVGEHAPIFSDLHDETANGLVEAKGTASRPDVRMALGQLADYGRFSPNSERVLLLPERPRDDLLALCSSQRH